MKVSFVIASCLAATLVITGCSSGSSSDAFPIDTAPEDTSPLGTLVFPAQNALTTEPSIVLRGAGLGEISSLTVNGISATSADNYATWQVHIPLSMGGNQLVFAINDETTQRVENHAITIERVSPFIASSEEFVLDEARNRLLLLDEDANAIHAVDLTTGQRSLMTSDDYDDAVSQAGYTVEPEVGAINPTTNELVIIAQVEDESNSYNDSLVAVDLETGERRIIALYSHFMASQSMIIDDAAQVAYATDWHNERIVKFDLSDGSHSTFVTHLEVGLPFHNRYYHVAWLGDEILWTVADEGIVYAVHKDTKATRTVFDKSAYPDMMTDWIREVVVDNARNQLLMVTEEEIYSFSLLDNAFVNLFDTSAQADYLDSLNAAVLSFDLLYLLDEDVNRVAHYDLVTGNYSVFEDDTVGTPVGHRAYVLEQNSTTSEFIVGDGGPDHFFSINQQTGDSTILLDMSDIDGINGYVSEAAVFNEDQTEVYLTGSTDAGSAILMGDLTADSLTAIVDSGFNYLSRGIDIDFETNTAYVIDQLGSNAQLKGVSLNDGSIEVISDTDSLPDYDYLWVDSLVFDPYRNNVYFEVDGDIVSVSVEDGAHVVLSADADYPDVEFSSVTNMRLVDENTLMLTDSSEEGVYTVDLNTGVRTVISSAGVGHGPSFDDPKDFVVDADNQLIYVLDSGYDSMYVIDQTSNERVIINR